MKILQAHNYYQFAGGEDTVVKAERDLLRNNGHEVIIYERNNSDIKKYSPLSKAALLWETSWSETTRNDVKSLIKQHSPAICHVHNFFPLITPSVYYACAEAGIPVVQTLHNYRLICANGLFFREGKICEKCLYGSSANAILHACYRNSRVQSATVVAMNKVHEAINTWTDKVDGYICLTEFARQKYSWAGFPDEKLFIKQNFLSYDPGFSSECDKYFLFVGRLDSYKGIHLLLHIASELDRLGYRIVVVGDGPDKELFENNSAVNYVGTKTPAEVLNLMKKCTALIFPSLLYEGMPMTIIEAFACGKPVIASRLGGPAEMIKDMVNGLLFTPGDTTDLVEKITWAILHPEAMNAISLEARRVFEEEYTAKKNHSLLLSIYQSIVDKKAKKVNWKLNR